MDAIDRFEHVRLAAMVVLLIALSACGSDGDGAGADHADPMSDGGSSNDSGSTSDDPGGPSSDAITIRVLSGRADTVSGGDALLEVQSPSTQDATTLQVAVNGQDVSERFEAVPVSNTLLGRIDGLQLGANEVVATSAGASTATLSLINHPASGPVISGPQQQPFFCQSEAFEIFPNGETLGAPLDENCSIDTRVDHVYRALDGRFLAFDPNGELPADVDSVTTTEGVELPYIVRIETGTLNRAIYQIAMLDEPSAPGPSLDTIDPGWNQRLVYLFGGGCRGGWYRQGSETGGVLNDIMLSRGYATASASLNVFGNNCNDLLAAETMMMVKERFIEAFGPPRYTIGWGCSGGSYQQHQIADNYPGLLDGILPECSFADVSFATAQTLADARLLDHYFRDRAALDWSDEQRRAVSGFGSVASIANLANGAARIDPVPNRSDGRVSAEFDPAVEESARYEPIARPAGARATIYDHTVNAYGRDPATGFARRPLDNVGIQYGLEALNSGTISPAQFLDLNERIGGFDIDANFIDERMVGDTVAIANAYRSGRLLNGGGGLSSIPILDYDYYYTDLEAAGDIHMRVQHFVTRQRLIEANGQADNQVMWSGGGNFDELATNPQRFNDRQRLSLDRMDEWLGNIHDDTDEGSAREKTLRNKPADLVDGCFSRDTESRFIAEPQRFGDPGSSTCNELYPVFPVPRQVAGGPLANNIVKCQLKPVDLSDYAVQFSAEQQARLVDVFAEGVCDWGKDGVEQTGLDGTWLQFITEGQYRPLGDTANSSTH